MKTSKSYSSLKFWINGFVTCHYRPLCNKPFMSPMWLCFTYLLLICIFIIPGKEVLLVCSLQQEQTQIWFTDVRIWNLVLQGIDNSFVRSRMMGYWNMLCLWIGSDPFRLKVASLSLFCCYICLLLLSVDGYRNRRRCGSIERSTSLILEYHFCEYIIM